MIAAKSLIPARSFFLPSERAETLCSEAYAIFAREEGPEGLYRPDGPVLGLAFPCGFIILSGICIFARYPRDTIPP
jgi:hypothetical protein